jgi:hypothetical protein
MGKLERIYPFMFMRLPRRMWSSVYFQNAKLNQRKLISHMDTYKTLIHFLYMNKRRTLLDNPLSKEIKSCATRFNKSITNERNMRGVSLFEKISDSRTCKDAMVPAAFCAC